MTASSSTIRMLAGTSRMTVLSWAVASVSLMFMTTWSPNEQARASVAHRSPAAAGARPGDV
jgi:hypothetical protein